MAARAARREWKPAPSTNDAFSVLQKLSTNFESTLSKKEHGETTNTAGSTSGAG